MVNEPVGIIGAGIVGLATARQLAQAGVPVTVWEKEPDVARHQTGRNSGVVHAGIYYQPGSAKAKNCRRGVELLRAYYAERDLPWLGYEPSSPISARTRALISSRMGRTCSTVSPAGSGRSQSRYRLPG